MNKDTVEKIIAHNRRPIAVHQIAAEFERIQAAHKVAYIENRRRLDALERELAAARADTARIDMLEKLSREGNVTVASDFPRGLRKNHWWEVFCQGKGTMGDKESLRAALDDAKEGKQP